MGQAISSRTLVQAQVCAWCGVCCCQEQCMHLHAQSPAPSQHAQQRKRPSGAPQGDSSPPSPFTLRGLHYPPPPHTHKQSGPSPREAPQPHTCARCSAAASCASSCSPCPASGTLLCAALDSSACASGQGYMVGGACRGRRWCCGQWALHAPLLTCFHAARGVGAAGPVTPSPTHTVYALLLLLALFDEVDHQRLQLLFGFARNGRGQWGLCLGLHAATWGQS